MQTLQKIPGKGSELETIQSGFRADTIDNPNPGLRKMEIWKNIPGYKGYYQASNFGRIRSLKRYCFTINGTCKIPFKRKAGGRVLKQNPSRGYMRITLSKKGNTKGYTTHRLIAITFIKNPKNKPEINHKNGIKTDNEVGNLEWVTSSENQMHSVRVLKKQIGENHPNSKFKNCQIKEIVKLHSELKNYRLVAEYFNVNRCTISRIIRGKTYLI